MHTAHPYSLGEGGVIGEKEILNGEPVPYTVKAEVTTHVLLLPSADLLYVKRERAVGATKPPPIQAYGVVVERDAGQRRPSSKL